MSIHSSRDKLLLKTMIKLTEIESRPHNIGFAIWRVKCYYETFVQDSTSVILLNFCAKMPPHRKAVNRYGQPTKATQIDITGNKMTEFWDTSFKDKKEMWGWEPADSAFDALELFKKYQLNNILIPGFGYGRNAKIFVDNGFKVTGIEISETAIDLAKKHFGNSTKIYHGSVSSMPFDHELYDGIFSYSLIHLLNKKERLKLIDDCYKQLKPNGYMVFVTISKMDFRYGQGKEICKDTFEPWAGLTLYFYDSDSIKADYSNYGLIDAVVTNEPKTDLGDKPSQKFWYIVCKKENK